MPSRSSTTDKLRRGAFRGHGRRSQAQDETGESAATVGGSASEVKVTPSAVLARRRREVETEFDLTTYSCQCGFVFQAVVVTSVVCPHCGESQAW